MAVKKSQSRLVPGDNVLICAADEFYSFVDGWIGKVTGFQSGCVEVTCDRLDGVKVLFVPEAQLMLSLRA